MMSKSTKTPGNISINKNNSGILKCSWNNVYGPIEEEIISMESNNGGTIYAAKVSWWAIGFGWYPDDPYYGIFRSTDCGMSWENVGFRNYNVSKIWCDPYDDNHLIVSSYLSLRDSVSVIRESLDGGNTWTNILEHNESIKDISVNSEQSIFALTDNKLLIGKLSPSGSTLYSWNL